MSLGPEPDFSNDDVFSSRFPVHRACRDGDVGVLVSLSQNQTHLTAEDSSYGWTPLHWAAHYGQLECVVHLVQMGCEVNTLTSRFNQTPTHTAAFGGHPQCVVWLTQAGADINRQDFVGEAPIHKAARSGSLECIQVLLIAGAKPHLRNASGQTAADLALTHGFHEGFLLLSKTQKHLQQLSGVHLNGEPNGNSTPGSQEVHGRKRLLNAAESGQMKRARRVENMALQMQNGGEEELESMNTESAEEMNSDEDTKAFTNGHHHTLPYNQEASNPPRSPSTSPQANQQAATPAKRSFSDMCGSLHLTGSPSSCVSHRPAWWGHMGGADFGGDLQYGHFHGFGDTAEELSSSRLDYCSSVQAEQRYKQAVASSIHLYHGS